MADVLIDAADGSFFLHPDLRAHPTGLACVDPLMKVVPALRAQGAKVLWVCVSLASLRTGCGS